MTFGTTLTRRGGPQAEDVQPQPQLFLALQADRPLAAPSRWSLAEVDEVTIGRGSETSVRRVREGGERRLAVQVPDRWMSASHARLRRDRGRWIVADADSKNGTFLNGVLEKHGVLSDGDLCECGHSFFLFRDAVPTATADPPDLDGAWLRPSAPGLATLWPPLARQFAQLEAVARSPVSVVIRGESGTGKEVIARAVHALSGRAGALVATNCGALPEKLVESELFGYKKGAFSGADEDRPGLVRSADRGTLFLDEIGDLPAPAQAAFLRVLQEREVLPVGATRPIKVDLRLVAATHRDLQALVGREQFRADLYARISGFSIQLPPLRKRREDLGLLVAALLARLAPDGGAGIGLSVEAARALFRYGWPLNVRELEKALGTAAILCRRGTIELADLPEAVRGESAATTTAPGGPSLAPAGKLRAAPARPLDAEQKRHRDEIVALLRQHGGNITAVARALGKARMQIQRWIKRYGIDPQG